MIIDLLLLYTNRTSELRKKRQTGTPESLRVQVKVIFNQTIKEDDFLMDTKSILSNPTVFASVGATVDPNTVTAYGEGD